jgi:hypothetical protein
MSLGAPLQQGDIAAEMERARVDFRHLLDEATSAELRAGTDGTKWTNEQLLFHMHFSGTCWSTIG